MKLHLTRPLAFFDLETTGTNIAKDRIVQIAVLKVHPDEKNEVFQTLVNPGIPIPEEVVKIHGIRDEDVAGKPSFKDMAPGLVNFLEGCDLAGYNVLQFDIPLLMEEFMRNKIQFELSSRRLIDVGNLFHKMEKRTLKAAYKFYTGNILTDAHDALADTQATCDVLMAMIDRYEGKEYDSEGPPKPTPIKSDVQILHDLSAVRRNLDIEGRIVLGRNNIPIFNFGKHKERPVEEVFLSEPQYYHWMMKSDFSRYTKKVVDDIWKKMRNKVLE